jgi:cytochrome c peroxidase
MLSIIEHLGSMADLKHSAHRVRVPLLAAAAVVAAAFGLNSTSSAAAALVGQSRSVEIPKPVDRSIDEMKADYRWPAVIPFPADNPYTAEKVALGKRLFFDSRLSAANLLSCASCHNPGFAWGDGQPKGVGHGMKQLGRRSPTIINAAFRAIFMWDGRSASLEEQALGPIKTAAEMNLPLDQLTERLRSVSEYGPLFQAVFPKQGITEDTVAKAIAAYERTVVSGRAPFDAWIEGDERAIPEDAKRGFTLFNTKARCASCHSGWNFTDSSFHDIGLADADIGRGAQMPMVVTMQHAFKTPGLREIARRGPYMHDGEIPTLEAVVEHYRKGGIDRPSRSELLAPLDLSERDKADLVAFMKTLSSDGGLTTIPNLPR